MSISKITLERNICGLSMNFLCVCVTFVTIQFCYSKSDGTKVYNKYLRLEIDFDTDIFLTLVFYYVHFKKLL